LQLHPQQMISIERKPFLSWYSHIVTVALLDSGNSTTSVRSHDGKMGPFFQD